jgi:APA family basic amino acid/polyamine antiporter
LFFRGAGRIHPTYQTPARSIIAQAIWSSILVLSGGADALTTYTGFAVVLFAGVAVLSLFVLRQREPNAPRPFKALGYPIAPAIFVIASLAIVSNALYADLIVPIRNNTPWGPAAIGLIIIGLGVPLYFFFANRKQ